MKATTIAVALGMTAAASAAVYTIETPARDPLGEELRGYGFLPIEPPSAPMDLGSLYYVSADASVFRAICHAEKADLEGAVSESRGFEIQESLKQNGTFATDVTVNLRPLIKGAFGDAYARTMQYSLTDVRLEEIPLDVNRAIFRKLMARAGCGDVALRYVNSGGYVCQGQKILRATAEFKLDRDSEAAVGSSGEATPDKINGVLKSAIAVQTGESVVEDEGRLFAGSALDYGVAMNPFCVAPANARFARILPRTILDRIVNYVLYRVVEPLLPAERDDVDLAQGGPAEPR